MKTMIVATDFSAASRNAFGYGVHLSRMMKARILAVYVIDTTDIRFALREKLPDIMSHDSAHLRAQVEAHIERRFTKLLNRHVHSNIGISTKVLRGIPSTEISRLASEVSAELIVVGTRCHGIIADAFLGSTTRELIRRAACPVLVLREDSKCLAHTMHRRSKDVGIKDRRPLEAH